MRYRYHTLDVFTDRRFGGNPLAVFPEASGLDGAVMQAVARELNLSETVFVLPAETPEGTRRVRIFTPGAEVPFAGHPTVGTAVLLASLGLAPLEGDEATIVLEEGVGPVRVRVHMVDGAAASAQFTAAKLPERGPEPPPAAELARVLSLDEHDVLAGDYAPAALSAGIPFLVVPLRDADALRRARLDPARWEALLAAAWAPNLYPIARDDSLEEADLRVRMFAPGLGVPEDPATGSAATVLAGYLAEREGPAAGTLAWSIEQGIEMGRPSRIDVEADKRGGDVVEIRVGGGAVRVADAEMEIE